MFGLLRLLQYLVFDETQHMYELFNKQSEIKNFLDIYKLEEAAVIPAAPPANNASTPPANSASTPSYKVFPPALIQIL